MRFFTLILFFCILTTLSYSQKELLSIKRVEGKPGLDEKSIDDLNRASKKILLTNPDSAHVLASIALINAEKINDSLRMGQSFLNLGTIYWAQSYYPISLFYLKSALNYFPKKASVELSEAYKQLGRTYADLKKYNESLYYLKVAQKFAGTDPGSIAEVYSEKAHVYYLLKKYHEALEFVNQSLQIDKANNFENNKAVLYSRFAAIYIKTNDYKKAREYNDSAVNLALKIRNNRLKALSYIKYAQIENGLGKYDNAIGYAKSAIEMATNVGVLDAETESFDEIVKSYKLKKDLKDAVFYQSKYNLLKDSLNNQARQKTILLVQNYYELNAKINGLEMIKANQRNDAAKIQFQNELIRLLSLFLFVLLVILFGTYYFYKQKKLLSSELQKQTEELVNQKQLIEAQSINLLEVNQLKDKLIAVIGHDLRSPFSNLTNIVEMFEMGALDADEVKSLMKTINPIVKGAELTLTSLMEWAASQVKGKNIQLANVNLSALASEVEQTFKHALQIKGITFHNNVKQDETVYADENHLKVILRNLVSNAIKFTDEGGTVTFSVQSKDNYTVLNIADTGKGMSVGEIDQLFNFNAHFSKPGTKGEKGSGLGLLLCKELIELNGGKLAVKSNTPKGSIFYFSVPKPN